MRRGIDKLARRVVITTVVAGSSVLAAHPAHATSPTCHGLPATIVAHAGDSVVNGTAGTDVIVGGPQVDQINGLAGDDTICGGRGAQRITGGPGDDLIEGGRGADLLVGDAGDDLLNGAGGSDTFVADAGNDRIIGTRVNHPDACDAVAKEDAVAWTANGWSQAGPATVDLASGVASSPATGTDTLLRLNSALGSSTGGDTLTGDDCANRLSAYGPHTTLVGGGGADDLGTLGVDADGDALSGGAGDDAFAAYADLPASIDGGGGIDIVDFAWEPHRIDVDLAASAAATASNSASITGIENAVGSFVGGGTVAGDDGRNVLYVYGQDGKVYGRGGDDQLFNVAYGDSLADGGDGVDTCQGPNQVNCENPA
jgi:hypothetical protein